MEGKHQNKIPSLSKLDSYDFENLFKVYQLDNGQYFYNLLNTVYIPDTLNRNVFTIYNVPGSNVFWTNISYQVYGTIKLWWLICVTNQIQNPFDYPEPGKSLKIIKPEFVRRVLENIDNNI